MEEMKLVEPVPTGAAEPPVPDDLEWPPTEDELPYDDGMPMESDRHVLQIHLLREPLKLFWAERENYFVGGNMFVYFSLAQVRNRDFRGPDFFFVWEVRLNPPRRYWAVWEEGGKYPDVIIELSSPSTAAVDHGVKKRTYEKIFRTNE